MAKLEIVRVRGEREVNSYLVACARTKEAAVIDPAEPAEKLIAQMPGLQLKWILATHGHPGHLAGKDALKDATGAPTAMHVTDAKSFLRSADRYLEHLESLPLGDLEVRVLHTPGHTPGSLCFLVGSHLFTGDTLLQGGIGKQALGTDLRRQLFSILNVLGSLSASTAVYPGHGSVTQMEREWRENPAFRVSSGR